MNRPKARSRSVSGVQYNTCKKSISPTHAIIVHTQVSPSLLYNRLWVPLISQDTLIFVRILPSKNLDLFGFNETV